MFNTVPKAHVYFRHATHLNLDQPVKSHMDVTISDFRVGQYTSGHWTESKIFPQELIVSGIFSQWVGKTTIDSSLQLGLLDPGAKHKPFFKMLHL